MRARPSSVFALNNPRHYYLLLSGYRLSVIAQYYFYYQPPSMAVVLQHYNTYRGLVVQKILSKCIPCHLGYYSCFEEVAGEV
jgi:hypothetical protein